MFIAKTDKTSKGDPLHFSVGAIIKQDNKFLLIDRETAPFGHAGPAGHVEENESPEEALRHQVKEETGLNIKSARLILEEEIAVNECKFGVLNHYWCVYECEAEGDVKLDISEAKSIGWYTAEEMQELEIEPIWQMWFKKTKII